MDPKSNRKSGDVRVARYKKPERSAVGVCTKYTLFFENFIVLIIGLALTGLTSYILVIKDKKVNDVFDFFLDPACVLDLAGCIILVMGFLGSIGALRENTCFLKMYYYLLCFFLLAEVVFAVLLFVAYYEPDFKTKLFPSDSFRTAIKNYRNDIDMQNLIDTMQTELECCGLSDNDKGFLDWNDNMYFNCSDTNRSPEKCSVPHSCCIKNERSTVNYMCGKNVFEYKNGEIQPNNLNTFHINKNGCIKALGDWIDTHSLVFGGVMVGILLPQVFVVVLTRNLIGMIAEQKSKW